ncbi:TPA: hypothetical protein ACPSFP_001763 [Haemophilus influenzae]
MKLLNKFLTFAFTAFLTLMLSNGVYAKMDFDKVYKETKKNMEYYLIMNLFLLKIIQAMKKTLFY